ncbi:MAG TPA: hypothetical protein VGK73_13975, partial [Polyangiaceae bacterium]
MTEFDGKRRARRLWALLASVPLLLWFGAAFTGAVRSQPLETTANAAPASSVSSAPSVPETAPARDGPPSYCLGRLLAPLRAAVAGSTAGEGTRPWVDEVDAAAGDLARTFGGEREPAPITTLIATIPDPIDSGLGYQFETALQALRRGIEHRAGTGFHRDRSWLPWDDREVKEAERRDSEECRRSTPGILLFRGGTPERPELFVLLVVGETPTSGLRAASLHTALDIYERLDRHRSKPGTAAQALEVRVVGPSYSGSAPSLRMALSSWAERHAAPVDFRIVSGSATGADVPRWLGQGSSRLAQNASISFQSTTVPEASVECAYLWYLASRLGVEPEPGFPDAPTGVPLAGVASLSESGTEFGATLGTEVPKSPPPPPAEVRAGTPPCKWRASIGFSFPFHVSALRDAYEDLDQREKAAPKESSIARATSLDASLREARPPLDRDSSPSGKTRTAEDLALGSVLERISTRHVRHLAIHATDVGDAIFLARRIRDVAPDVRLSFFDSDALLLHADFRRELLGSLVVSPYPFRGLSEFALQRDGRGAFAAFESGNMQGLYNAVLAQRGVRPSELSEYTIGSNLPLPVWVSAIGRAAIVPANLSPTLDCSKTLYGSPDPSGRALCGPPGAERTNAWREFKRQSAVPLRLEKSAKLPYLWDLLLATLILLWCVDVAHQNAGARRLARDRFPEEFAAADDRTLDRAMGRTKWRLYAVIRSFLFALAFAHMTTFYALALVARGGPTLDTGFDTLTFAFQVLVAVASVVLAVSRTILMATRFLRDYRAFARCVASKPGSTPPAAPETARSPGGTEADASAEDEAPLSIAARSDRITFTTGFVPTTRHGTARTSLLQLRILAVAAASLAVFFTVEYVLDTLRSTDVVGLGSDGTVQRLTLFVVRGANLASGVSPSTPALLCMACVYVWALGRMARLALAHSISRSCPPDGETDLVSTPIRLILYPRHSQTGEPDAGFTHVERGLLDAIWRPINHPYYVAAALGMAFFPVAVFALKRPSTLESPFGTWFLAAGVGMSSFLIGVTLIQLVQYWLALRLLLKRLLEHPLGAAFQSVPSFARDSVDHQLSRSPDEPLRWSTCAVQFSDLMRAARGVPGLAPLAALRTRLERAETELSQARIAALEATSERSRRAPADEHRDEWLATLESDLTCRAINAASTLTEVLEEPWTLPASPESAARDASRSAGASEPDALTPCESAYRPEELRWLRSAQVFVATVVTLLL